MLDTFAEVSQIVSVATSEVFASVERIKSSESNHHSLIGPEVLKLHEERKWSSVYPKYRTWEEFVAGEFEWSERYSYKVLERARTAKKLGLTDRNYPTYKEAAKLSRVPDAVLEDAVEEIVKERAAPRGSRPAPTISAEEILKIVEKRASEPVATEEAFNKITTDMTRFEPKKSKEEKAFIESIAVRDALKTDRSRTIFDAEALDWFRADEYLEIIRKRGIGKTRDGQIAGEFQRLLRRVISVPAPHAWLVCCARDDASETCNGGFFPSGKPCGSCGKKGYVI